MRTMQAFVHRSSSYRAMARHGCVQTQLQVHKVCVESPKSIACAMLGHFTLITLRLSRYAVGCFCSY